MNYFFLSAAQNQWTIYWVAGQGNMHSKQEDLQEETHILWNFISILLNKADLNLSAGTFIFASSAGAVYAGVQDILINKSTFIFWSIHIKCCFIINFHSNVCIS
jgi:hypothetical protein